MTPRSLLCVRPRAPTFALDCSLTVTMDFFITPYSFDITCLSVMWMGVHTLPRKAVGLVHLDLG